MAKNETQSESEPRVYKASEVHKRRAKPKPHDAEAPAPVEEPADKPDAPASGAEDPAPSAAKRTGRPRFTYQSLREEEEGPDVLFDSEEGSPNDSAPAQVGSGESTTRRVRATRNAAKTAGEAASTGDDEDAPVSQPPKKRSRARRILGIVGGVVAALLLVSVGFFSAQRWFIYDDQTTLLGEWYAEGTSAPVTITDNTIKLNIETTYDYEIDPVAKTISYRFGNLEGHGRYWFSDDRKTLVITDGEGFNMWSTLFQDIAHAATDLFDNIFSGGAKLPSGDNVVVLTRTPTKGSVTTASSLTTSQSTTNGLSVNADRSADSGASVDGENQSASASQGRVTETANEEGDA